MMQFPHTKAILFDWDLTLVQPLLVMKRAFRKVGKKYGVDLIAAVAMKDMYADWEQALHDAYAKNRNLLPDREIFVHEVLEELVFAHRGVELTHGPILKRLRGHGLKMGLVTLNVYRNVSIVLKKADFRFDVYVTLGDVTDRRVPKSEGIRDAMTQLVVRDHETVYVGDTIGDIAAARDVGIPVVAVTTGVYTKDELREAKPDAIIDHMSELESLFI